MISILCTECNMPITQKKDLVVAGKLLQPYHASCLKSPKSRLGKLRRFSGRFPVGIKFWILLFIGNMFGWEILTRNPDSTTALFVFFLIFNVVFIGGRVGIFYSYEQYLE